MKHIVIALLLMLAPVQARAAWVLVGSDEEANYYIDPATIHKNGNIRSAWMLSNLRQRDHRDGEMSRLAFVDYDCKETRSTFRQETLPSEQNAFGNTLRRVNGLLNSSSLTAARLARAISGLSVPAARAALGVAKAEAGSHLNVRFGPVAAMRLNLAFPVC